MKISYNWLKQFVDIPVSARKLAEDLCLFGHEVDDVIKYENDWLLNLSITANRGDCLSVLGMAREISAIYNKKINDINIKIKDEEVDKKISVAITDPEICTRFSARIIDNIEINDSPKWIKEKLKRYGFRSINNIVDITNLVMVEMGQPLHAFDYHKINCGNVIIRRAKNNESLITLDGIDRKLDKDSVIIEDKKKIYDLAGIMGAFNSEIDTKTKTILLQGSVFNPILIRRTSKRLKLTTDASYRFERNVDFNGTVVAINRGAELIKQSSKKTKIGQLIDIKKHKHQNQLITISSARINSLIGKKFNQGQIIKTLARLNIKCHNNICKIPSYRSDLVIWQALAGEIARIYGLNKLLCSDFKKTKAKVNLEFIKKEFIKDMLVNRAFTEIYSYSFADEGLLKVLGSNLEQCRYVINSVTPENKYLRPNLESSILSAIAKNPWAPEINIFEIGKVFNKFEEKWQLAIATTQKKANNIQDVLNSLHMRTNIVSVDQKILDFVKIRKSIKLVIIDLDKIKINAKSYQEEFKEIKYKAVSEFPPTVRDLAFIINKQINASEVEKYINNINDHILLVECFDEFESERFGQNNKSIAYHIWIQDLNKPVNKKMENKIVIDIINKLKNKFGAILRS